MDTKGIVDEQRTYFFTNVTKDIDFRLNILHKLKNILKAHEDDFLDALNKDLGKSRVEGYMTEIGMVYEEINLALKNLKKWGKPHKVKGNLMTFPSKSFVYYEPYGNTLILAPWNYPLNLSLCPLVGAIAAGNTVVLKSSKNSINTSLLIMHLLNDNFDKRLIYVVDPYIEYDEVTNQKYDYIFFTGSPRVGRIIMKEASENLTPVSLELGGKSPCFVTKYANLELAAKRIVWGKFLNAGQTCISIDYVVVDKLVKEKFIDYLKGEIVSNFNNAQESDDYSRIVNEHHFDRLLGLISSEKEAYGGAFNREKLKISPTLLPDANFDSKSMQDEIFGPILPVISYDNLEQIIVKIKENPKPLATYIFSNNKDEINKILSEVSFGGGCINDVFMHLANNNIPFGGVGNSGMGNYHGKYSFMTFSHAKSIVKSSSKLDIKIRYQPYDEKKLKLIKKILK